MSCQQRQLITKSKGVLVCHGGFSWDYFRKELLTELNGIITAILWVTTYYFASLSWVTGCLVSTETCFTFPFLLGLSIYFEHMLKRHCPFWQWMLRKLPWPFVIQNRKKEAYVYVTSVHPKSTSWHSSLLAIETVWRQGDFIMGSLLFFISMMA